MAKHIYIHIPFCEAKCPYCDFYSEAGRPVSVMMDVMHAMADEISGLDASDEIETIYFGGGTPSVWQTGMIPFLMDKIHGHFRVASDAEITVEVNPSSLDAAKAHDYRSCGVNRISVGVQSMHDDCLKTLGRLHNAEKALKCIDILHDNGFSNISADLIIAVPGQRLDDVINDLHTLADWDIKHISTYSLTLEKGTPFYKRYADMIDDLVPPDKERAMYHALRAELIRLGYLPYEISNSCIPGFTSRHNSSYWEGEEYYGIGPGAHGYIDGTRYYHENELGRYLQDPAVTIVEEVLDKDAMMHEYPYLKLRTFAGIDVLEFEKRFGVEFMSVFGEAVAKNVAEGLLISDGKNVMLTEKGIDWSNKVFEDFL
ncbi:MAG: radical SAM family heme chaperone HemW [Clostridiales bacterium]|nr:radical SAM family heme chaperone HemW [Clostridiales bacterium]